GVEIQQVRVGQLLPLVDPPFALLSRRRELGPFRSLVRVLSVSQRTLSRIDAGLADELLIRPAYGPERFGNQRVVLRRVRERLLHEAQPELHRRSAGSPPLRSHAVI